MSAFTGLSLGKSYPYYQYIKGPQDLGMSTNGSDFANNLKGIGDYGSFLVNGNGPVSVTGQPLGNQYFLNTGGQCTANVSPSSDTSCNNSSGCSTLVDRYMYVNNITTGDLSFQLSGSGPSPTITGLPRGLLVGILQDIEVLDPFTIFDAITQSTTPPCTAVTLYTTDISNNKSQGTYYVTNNDIVNINPCSFVSGSNILTNETCSEGFSNIYQKGISQNSKSIDDYFPSDTMILLYFIMLIILGMYIFYKMMHK